jgi:hypothetical protein
MKTTTVDKTKKQLTELIATLGLQFLLGVALTTVIEYEPQSTSMTQKAVLGAHIFLGVYILVIASLRVARAQRLKRLVPESWLGLVAIIVAFGTGSIAMRSGNAWATLAMAVGFVVAFAAYFVSLSKTK